MRPVRATTEIVSFYSYSQIKEITVPGKNVFIPAQTTNSSCVAGHAAKTLLVFNIPQLR